MLHLLKKKKKKEKRRSIVKKEFDFLMSEKKRPLISFLDGMRALNVLTKEFLK